MAIVASGASIDAAAWATDVQPTSSAVVQPSASCKGTNVEPGEATDPTSGRQYIAWEGCGGVAFASRAPGKGFSPPLVLPHSKAAGVVAWDPAIAVAPNGTVYVTFEVQTPTKSYPVIAASNNGGASFAQVVDDSAVPKGNWGVRPNLAIAADSKTVFLSWDYGPSAALVNNGIVCSPSGSCAFTTGDLNIVVQASTDGGKTFGARNPLTPASYPFSGSDIGPITVEPNGTIACVYQGYRTTNQTTGALAPGNVYFTSSANQGKTWSTPILVGASAGTMSLDEWWDEPSLSIDAGGNIYAVWDTQSGSTDVGWVAFSSDRGQSWSAPLQASSDNSNAPHIMNVIGLGPGSADVVWLSSSDPRGYALFARPLSVQSGWLAPQAVLSTTFGNAGISPGDTIGVARADSSRLAISWGGTTASSPSVSQISAGTFPN